MTSSAACLVAWAGLPFPELHRIRQYLLWIFPVVAANAHREVPYQIFCLDLGCSAVRLSGHSLGDLRDLGLSEGSR